MLEVLGISSSQHCANGYASRMLWQAIRWENSKMTTESVQTTPAMLLTPKQAACVLAISGRKLWAMTASGEIPHLRLGRCVRYPVDELKRFLDKRKKGGEAR